jgi:hypothetical protein
MKKKERKCTRSGHFTLLQHDTVHIKQNPKKFVTHRISTMQRTWPMVPILTWGLDRSKLTANPREIIFNDSCCCCRRIKNWFRIIVEEAKRENIVPIYGRIILLYSGRACDRMGRCALYIILWQLLCNSCRCVFVVVSSTTTQRECWRGADCMWRMMKNKNKTRDDWEQNNNNNNNNNKACGARSATFFYGVETLWRAMDRCERRKIHYYFYNSLRYFFDKKKILSRADTDDYYYCSRRFSLLLYARYVLRSVDTAIILSFTASSTSSSSNSSSSIHDDDERMFPTMMSLSSKYVNHDGGCCEVFHETNYARRQWTEEENDSEDGWSEAPII